MVSDQLNASANLIQPPIPTGQKAGWTSEPISTTCKTEKNVAVPGIKLRPLLRPDPSQSLYRLSYPGSDTATTKATTCVGVDVQRQTFFTSMPHKSERLAVYGPTALFPEKSCWAGYWLGPRAGLDDAAERRKFSWPQSVH
jgi:hypothetical protein